MTRAEVFIAFALLAGGSACSFPEVSYRSGGGGDGGDGGAGNPGGGSMQGNGGAGGEGAATSTNTSTNTSTSTGMGGGEPCTDADGDKYVLEANNGACLPPAFSGYGDCDDQNSSVHPNQMTYFTTPRAGFPVNDEEAWNYDCNGRLDLLFEVGCKSGLSPKDGLEVSEGVSGCGDTGMWREGGTVTCMNIEEEVQGCR